MQPFAIPLRVISSQCIIAKDYTDTILNLSLGQADHIIDLTPVVAVAYIIVAVFKSNS